MGPNLKDETTAATKGSLQMGRLARPSSWGFDLSSVVSSVASSGYCSAENSTESEYPPFDWDYVVDKLEDLRSSPQEVTVEVPEKTQYILNDCFFTVRLNNSSCGFSSAASSPLASPSTPSSWPSGFWCSSPTWKSNNEKSNRSSSRTLEAYVVGPSGNNYEVFQSPGKLSSEVICTFRPLECGPHTCHVTLLNSQSSEPPPFVININRKYEHSKLISSTDIEIINEEDSECPFTTRKPWGICSNKKNDLVYIADREYHEVLIYGADGEQKGKFGKRGQRNGEFFRPTAVAYDETHDRILVADKDNHRIQIFTPEGKFIKSFGRRGNFPGQFFFPWGVAVSKDGRFIAVADSRNHRVQLFNHEGTFLRKYSAGSGERGSQAYKKEFDYPRGICFDLTAEHIYVTDFNLHALFRIPIDMKSCEKLLDADTLKRPQGVAVDDCGNIVVCDSRNNQVKVLSKEGKFIGQFGTVGNKMMDLPLDIHIMKGGYVAILDMNGRVLIF